MRALSRALRAGFVLALGGAMSLTGCSVSDPGGDDPAPAEEKPPVADTFFSAASKNLEDSTTTRVTLTTTAELDTETNQVHIYALPKGFAGPSDTAGRSLLSMGKNNFSVVLDPKNAPKAVDPAGLTVETDRSGVRVVALVMDTSGSMASVVPDANASRLAVAKDSATGFIRLMSGTDQTALVAFSTEARLVHQLTKDQQALIDEIGQFAADGSTNIGDAVTEAVRAVGTRPGKRAVILLTDGGDTEDSVTGGPAAWNHQPESKRYQGLRLAKENDLRIYTVGFGLNVDSPSDDEKIAIDDLNFFASETGGKAFFADTAGDLDRAFGETIPGEIDRLEPLETFRISFDNPVKVSDRSAKRKVAVPLRVGVGYVTSKGLFRGKFNGSYLVTAPGQ